MIELHFPWLELTILLPLAGALWVLPLRDSNLARRRSLIVSGLTLFAACCGGLDFVSLHTFQAHDRWDFVESLIHTDALVVDELSGPLLPLAALLFFLTQLATLRTKVRRFSFSGTLVSEALLLATFSCKIPWVLVLLLIAATIPPYLELRHRRKPTRVYALHMAVMAVLLVVGQTWFTLSAGPDGNHSHFAVMLLAAALLLRSGVAPVHCWMTDLFEHATFGTALLFVTPMVGVYGAMRLVLPFAPEWVLRSIAMLSLVTAIYAAGMALVQREARRFFCYLFLSHSSLVLVGLETVTPIGLTGALCLWLSVSLAMAGFGLTLRSVEARTGRLSLDEYHGLYDQLPMLAGFFLLTGLAAIGFPGTIGFIGAEMLVEGAVQFSPIGGMAVVITAALNGLAVMQAYFRVFTGVTPVGTIDMHSRFAERVGVLTLTLLIIGGGILPQPGVSSRYHAALKLLEAAEIGSPMRHAPVETAGVDNFFRLGPGGSYPSRHPFPPITEDRPPAPAAGRRSTN